MADAWTILKDNSTESNVDAWTHLNNQVGGSTVETRYIYLDRYLRFTYITGVRSMSLKANQIPYVEGDTLPYLRGVVSQDDGTPEDITGWTITAHIKYATPLSKDAVILDAANGIYEFQWSPGDLQAGKWKIEFQHIDASGGIQTINRHEETGSLFELVIDSQVA